MTTAVMTINGKAPLPTILGQGVARIPTAGKIRAGIKVLTKAANANPKAKEIYDRGVAVHKSFDEIEREIIQAIPELKNPLTPRNVPWFTVRGQDFPNPQIAQQIMDTFGEERGDGIRRLYRFPVLWPADQLHVVMPHQLVAWGANDKKFWSEYSPDGQIRYCKCYAPIPKDVTGKRVIRQFGGRKETLRPENGGLCNPEGCPEYQNRQCNLSGRFIFYIPGIKSIDAFELATNSFYAMNAAIQKFQAIAFMRGGRLSGFLDSKATPFYITKKLMEVPHIDETGRAVRVKHWIIELEAPVDVSALLRANEDEDTLLAHASNAVNVLEGCEFGNSNAGHELDSIDRGPVESSVPVSFETNASELSAAADISQPRQVQTKPQSAYVSSPTTSKRTDIERPNVDQVIRAVTALGIEPSKYEAYAAKRWGPGWKMNAGGRRRALEEIERFRSDPEGLTSKISAEVDVFS
jgi:hypothetical protein